VASDSALGFCGLSRCWVSRSLLKGAKAMVQPVYIVHDDTRPGLVRFGALILSYEAVAVGIAIGIYTWPYMYTLFVVACSLIAFIGYLKIHDYRAIAYLTLPVTVLASGYVGYRGSAYFWPGNITWEYASIFVLVSVGVLSKFAYIKSR